MWGTKLTSWVPRISWDAVLPSVQIVLLASQLSHNCIRSDGGLLSVPQCHNNRWSLCSESSKHRTQLPLEPFLHLVTSMKTVFEVLFDARFSVFWDITPWWKTGAIHCICICIYLGPPTAGENWCICFWAATKYSGFHQNASKLPQRLACYSLIKLSAGVKNVIPGPRFVFGFP